MNSGSDKAKIGRDTQEKRRKAGALRSGFDTGPVKIIWIKFVDKPGGTKRVFFRMRPNGTMGASDFFGYFATTGNKTFYDKLIADFVSGAVGNIDVTISNDVSYNITNYYTDRYILGELDEAVPTSPTGNVHGKVTDVKNVT